MGYRHYFYLVSKEEVEKVKDMGYSELYEYAKQQGAETNEDGDDWFSFIDEGFMNKQAVFEFGKLYWDDTADRIYSTGVPLFSREGVQSEFDDYKPYVVGKEGVLEAIKIYQDKVLRYYNSILSTEEGEPEKKALMHVQDKVSRLHWGDLVNVDDELQWSLTGSWEYEHSIFNLVHLLKKVDWDNYTLLFYGW